MVCTYLNNIPLTNSARSTSQEFSQAGCHPQLWNRPPLSTTFAFFLCCCPYQIRHWQASAFWTHQILWLCRASTSVKYLQSRGQKLGLEWHYALSCFCKLYYDNWESTYCHFNLCVKSQLLALKKLWLYEYYTLIFLYTWLVLSRSSAHSQPYPRGTIWLVCHCTETHTPTVSHWRVGPSMRFADNFAQQIKDDDKNYRHIIYTYQSTLRPP